MSFRLSLRAAQPVRAGLRATAPTRTAIPRNFAVRGYASGPTPGAHPPPSNSANKGTTKMLGLSVAVLAGAAGAFLLFNDDKKATLGVGKGQPASKLKGSKAKSAGRPDDGTSLAKTWEDYQDVYNTIAQNLENVDYDDGSMGPVLLRLAWHASGTFDKASGTGGSHGATMRFAPESSHGANAGLGVARDFMEQIKQQFPWISYSDLWTLGGVVAVQEAGLTTKVPWRPGRSDKDEKGCAPDGRLPDGAKGQDHLRDIFYRMGWNDEEIVTLAGAHALGRCHTDRSGFDGPWQTTPTMFNNSYFQLLTDAKWVPRDWDGPMQYKPADPNMGEIMMLPTDMALIKDRSFAKYVKQFAADEQLFFDKFSKTFSKLLELGVSEDVFKRASHLLPNGKPLTFKTLEEQGIEA